ncbi:MAG: hypothetical protein DWH91_06830 [Planctomycetota bacterium]|nr:MAG: hypothetical protein DWH91_06830 [Planctomycetota bacterium]
MSHRAFVGNVLGVVVFWLWVGLSAHAEEPSEGTATASDSGTVWKDDRPDAQQMLEQLAWTRGRFPVTWSRVEGRDYQRLVRFPTPHPSGNAQNDLVSMEWYQPKKPLLEVGPLPVIVVIHESGSAMPAGRAIARGIQQRGLHAVLLHLPYYGERRGEKRRDAADFLVTMRQGVADVRRAFDAVAELPGIDRQRISLQGTSLGGFVATSAASLDGCYHQTFIMLAGGDLFNMIQTGKQDTARVREQLAAAGYEGEALRGLLNQVEPTRIAHRLPSQRTWIYAALQDDVVPIRNARVLADAIPLERSHRMEFVGGHYTAALWLPVVVDHFTQQARTPVSVPPQP